MDNYIENQNSEQTENVLAGIVGAFLFSLVGGVVYFLLYLFGYVASISGLIGAVCAVKGYSLFAKKESKKGIIIAAIVSLLVMAIAWYFSLSYEIFEAYKVWFEAGEVDYTLTFVESVRATPIFLEDSEIARSAFGDLGISLFFCLLGCVSFVISKFKNANKKNKKTEIDSLAVAEESKTENDIYAYTESKSENSNIE